MQRRVCNPSDYQTLNGNRLRARKHTVKIDKSTTGIPVQVVECLVPAINPEELLLKSKPKRIIKLRRFEDFESTNIVIYSVENNSKALETTPCKTEQYKNSFFIKSAISWNQLDWNILCSKSVESFKSPVLHQSIGDLSPVE